MTHAPGQTPRSVEVRAQVVEAAVELFSERGFESTSVDDLARAAGMSRSTYFRQVGGKEDAVFADHPPLLEELGTWMDAQAGAEGHPADPWVTVCAASERVFAHLSEDLDLARRRYTEVRAVRALRDREIITERGYERLFSDYLRRSMPGLEAVDAIGFAALVTATHNHFLRQAIRTESAEPAEQVRDRHAAALDAALVRVRQRFGVGSGPDETSQQVLVASLPATMPSGEVLRRIREALAAEAG
ncbi:helix-turn-helix domain-containing protein [Citricoccus nitrophenolicus]|uniref:Helix-turn-helix domain-containing protein n=1 Tax=Citricoccus nitrophenolicus TaxID=863575 RepID=A0ABV0IM98_9MICC|nr:helix-turn-helix domain-containing protein [Citricoccus sp. I39-566]WMY78429.1 helix-turn-helix domain-containing protein [Citricoccus sp. I39-566]